MLKRLDEGILAAVRKGTIRLLSIDFLLSQPEDWQPPRMQECASAGALVPPEEAAQVLERGDRSVFVLSYGACTGARADSPRPLIH